MGRQPGTETISTVHSAPGGRKFPPPTEKGHPAEVDVPERNGYTPAADRDAAAEGPTHMANTEATITRWLAGQEGAMRTLLRRLVEIDSNSYDKPGVDAVGAEIVRFLAQHGIAVETKPQAKHGDTLLATVPAAGSGGNAGHILLMGHRDTVFPPGEAGRRPYTERDGLAFGPGVADMKAGLVMNCFLLAAFARFGGHPAPLVGLFTGDEEIGSPEGRPVIEAAAAGARAVLNSEPGRVSGNVVTGRKGGVFMSLRVTGRAAHAGGNFSEGISAIEELAHKILAIQTLTDIDRGITLNVGLISGGQSVNTVAPWAEAMVDLRYMLPDDRPEMMVRLNSIASRSRVSGTSAELVVRGEFLPLEQTPGAAKLFAAYAASAAATGLSPGGEFTGGCADSGFTARIAPTLCGVGPVGGKAHTPDEFLRLDTLVPRAQACARTILRLDAAGL